MRRMAELVAEQFVRMGLPALLLEPWVRDGADFPPTITDVAHPTGTTRMSDDPTKGVVDAQCCVHGVEGLYVAGSSVFSTIGHCNPTQMIVALALRPADQLKARAEAARTAAVRTIAAAKPGSARVLITGATGRIGRVVVSDLLKRGYFVRATTSKVPPSSSFQTIRIRVVLFLAIEPFPGARVLVIDDGHEVFFADFGGQSQDACSSTVPDTFLGQVVIAGRQFPLEVSYGRIGFPDLRGGNHAGKTGSKSGR